MLSIGSLEKKKGLKKLAKSLGRVGRGSKKSFDGSFTPESRGQHLGDADPGVISEGESDDEFRVRFAALLTIRGALYISE